MLQNCEAKFLKRFVCRIIWMIYRFEVFSDCLFTAVQVVGWSCRNYFLNAFAHFGVTVQNRVPEFLCLYAFDCVPYELCDRIIKRAFSACVSNFSAERNVLLYVAVCIDNALYVCIVSVECLILPEYSLCQSLFEKAGK